MKLWNRLRFRLRRPQFDRDLAEEIRLHREMLEEQFAREGLPPEDAHSAAVRRFGNRTASLEQSREAWSFVWLESILKDVRFAGRLLAKQPLLAAIAVLTVAFGVGANTAIVSVLETVLFNPLGLRDAGKVMVARIRLEKIQMRHASTSGVEFREFQTMTDAFSSVAAVEGRAWTSQSGSEAERLVGRAVTPEFFRVFGEQPFLGRFFNGADRESVVLSYALWRSHFGADPSVTGRVLMLDDKPYRIAGVAPAAFRFPPAAQAWVPLLLNADRLANRGKNMNLALFARLRDGITPAQAVDRVNRHVVGLKMADAGLVKGGYSIELDPFAEYVAGDLKRPLWLLWAAALVVLLTGCANVAGLLLTRTAGRRKEIAIRISVGATRTQIIRQLLIESLLLGTLGGLAGVAMASVAIRLLNRLPVHGKELLALVTLDSKLLVYSLGLALLCGFVFGLAPVIQILRESQSAALHRSRRRWFQDLFVTAQVAGAFVLVVMTILLLRSLWTVEQIKPGFDPGHLSTAFVIKPQNDPGFFHRIQENLRSSPGIESVALANPVLFAGGGLTSSFGIKGRQRNTWEPEWHGEAYQITPGYLATLRIPLLRGRDLSDSDTATSRLVCLIDAKLAERFFPNQDPIGQEISMYKGWAVIVGVTGAIRGTTLEDGSRPVVYYSLAQVPYFPQVAIIVRSSLSAGGVIREAVRRANAGVPVYDILTMEDRIGESLGIRRVIAILLSVFGGISLLLAAIGLYGVIAQVVSERTHEVGVRIALGARPAQILSLFMRQGLQSGILGLLLGIVVSAYTRQWLVSLLYGVEPFDSATLVFAGLGILSILSAAVWWPARRAARVDPQIALRYE